MPHTLSSLAIIAGLLAMPLQAATGAVCCQRDVACSTASAPQASADHCCCPGEDPVEAKVDPQAGPQADTNTPEQDAASPCHCAGCPCKTPPPNSLRLTRAVELPLMPSVMPQNLASFALPASANADAIFHPPKA